MKYLLISLFCIGTLSTICAEEQYSLKGIDKTINISTNTVDTKQVLLEVDKKMKKFDFNKLKDDLKTSSKHINRIDKAQNNLKQLTNLKTELELNYLDIEQLKQRINKAKQQYGRSINRIYNKNKQIDRYSYLVVVSKGDFDYAKDLENFLIDKFAIKKYDQATTLNKSLASVEMKSIIKTQKDFGQKNIDTIYDYVVRANNVTIKVLKVIQNPFIKSDNSTSDKSIETINNEFSDSKVKVYDLRTKDYQQLNSILQKDYHLSKEAREAFMTNLMPKIDISEYKKDFIASSSDISKVLKKLELKHIEQAAIVSNLQSQYEIKKDINVNIEPRMNKLLKETQKLLKPYSIPLTKETIGVISIATPKIYTEVVQYKEEKEFVSRKIKSYISKITVSDLAQSDTLIDFTDLSSTTKKRYKSVEFETLHILPFLQKGNKIGLLVFASISIKDDLTEDDLLSFDFKYGKVKFLPFQKGYKTIFSAQNEVTLGLVKEFLETNSFKRYFDQYCIDDSYLPEEAKDFKHIDEEFYKYPAVCFKVDKIEKFVNWVSEKTQRKIIVPVASDWAFVATNSATTDYCWGNATPEDLLEEERLPENIYIEGGDQDTTIQKTASFAKSKSGIYDMCGNVFELVMQDGELGYKGNSFSSYIEMSGGEAESYEDDVNPTLGLRLFYIKDLTNE